MTTTRHDLYRQAALALLEIRRLLSCGRPVTLARQRLEDLVARAMADPGFADDVVCWRVTVRREEPGVVSSPGWDGALRLEGARRDPVEDSLNWEKATPDANLLVRKLNGLGLAAYRRPLCRPYLRGLRDAGHARHWLEEHAPAAAPAPPDPDDELCWTITSGETR